MKARYDIPVVALGTVASLLNDHFKLDPPLKHATPFTWWDRTKNPRDVRLTDPMPEPSAYVGEKRSPVWHEDAILDWYASWKGIPRPRVDV